MLEAVAAHTPLTHELILIDNGTGHYIEPASNRTVIRNAVNEGYAKASNAGADAATADVLVMLNVDTMPQHGWLEAMLAALADEQVAMVGAKLVYPDGRIQCAGIRTWHGNGSAGGENRHDEHATNSDEDGVTGACMMIRRNVFNAVGQFDAQFWNGYEDVDLCLAVKAAGHKIAYVAEAVVVHHESVSGQERWVKAVANTQYMASKWGSR